MDERVERFDNNAAEIFRQLDREIASFKSDLDITIDNSIALFFGRDEAKREIYEQNLERIHVLIQDLDEAEKRWQAIKPAIDGLEGYDPDADLMGDYLALDLELGQPKASRAQQVGLVKRVAEHLKNAKQDPDLLVQFSAAEIFNIVQIARRLRRPDLEQQLVTAAYEADSTLSGQALLLQHRARHGAAAEREKAFNQVMQMVTQLTMDSPHIVIAEAWNAAEELRRYSDLINALDRQIVAHEEDSSILLPSYVYAVRGNAYQRRGLPGDIPLALESYKGAIERLSLEGTFTQWSEATIRDTVQGAQSLYQSGIDVGPLIDAAKASKIQPLSEALGPLKLFVAADGGAFSEGESEVLQHFFEMMGESGEIDLESVEPAAPPLESE